MDLRRGAETSARLGPEARSVPPLLAKLCAKQSPKEVLQHLIPEEDEKWLTFLFTKVPRNENLKRYHDFLFKRKLACGSDADGEDRMRYWIRWTQAAPTAPGHRLLAKRCQSWPSGRTHSSGEAHRLPDLRISSVMGR